MKVEKTPCQKRGYSIGDEFVVGKGTGIFSDGAIVRLEEDDGTKLPLFRLIEGYCEFDNVKTENGKRVAGAFLSLNLVLPRNGQHGSNPVKAGKAYRSVKTMNTAFGRFQGAMTYDKRLQQLRLIEEELNEGILAIKKEGLLEELDAACDMFVTVAGYMQQLEHIGCDVGKALKLVCENNLSKLIKADDVDEMNATIHKYKAEGVDILIEPSGVDGFVVAKHPETGKGLKPASYQSVDISMCLP